MASTILARWLTCWGLTRAEPPEEIDETDRIYDRAHRRADDLLWNEFVFAARPAQRALLLDEIAELHDTVAATAVVTEPTLADWETGNARLTRLVAATELVLAGQDPSCGFECAAPGHAGWVGTGDALEESVEVAETLAELAATGHPIRRAELVQSLRRAVTPVVGAHVAGDRLASLAFAYYYLGGVPNWVCRHLVWPRTSIAGRVRAAVAPAWLRLRRDLMATS